jgi:hypothetical protein
MTTVTARRPAAISKSSRRNIVGLAWASSVIICSVVMLVVGIIIGNFASSRVTKETRGIT